jgi:hypothetical protein
VYQAPPPLPDDLTPPRRDVFGFLGVVLALAGAATLLGVGDFQGNLENSAVITFLLYIVWSIWRIWRRSW